jgi:K+-sensing histidine kinase KdpD
VSGYVVAIAATLGVVVLRLLLSHVLGDSAYFFPFVIAVTLSAWYGGLKPGLLSTILGALAAIFFFVPPFYSFTISDSRIATGLVFFLISNVTISLVCDALHKALRRVELSEAAALQHVKDL